jgi:hypothetical protein
MTHPSFRKIIEKPTSWGIYFCFFTVTIFPAEVFVMNERGGTSSEAAKEMKKTSTKNSIRGAKVVADDEGVKTTRE